MNVRNPRIAIVAAATAAATAATAAALIGAAPDLRDALDSRSAPVDQPVLAGRARAGDVTEPVWVRALRLRSEALDRQYALGTYAGGTVRSVEPIWLRALRLRSEALDRQYALGAYAGGTVRSVEPIWLRALRLRSEALDRQYGLG